MKNIGIITNAEKDENLKYTRLLADCIEKCGGSVRLPGGIASMLGASGGCRDDDELVSGSDMIICLGGDGTFLKVARKVCKSDKPILGVNLGSLGFLTEIERSDVCDAARCVLEGNYVIEERMMLEMTIYDGSIAKATDSALNDVVISHGELSRLLHLDMYINNVFADSFPGDGLIVSSPTGSTAYSLSAGGPIVEPDVDLMIVTPICPHILYSRSFITSGGRVVKIVLDENANHDAMVTVDGQEGYRVYGGYRIEVRKSVHTIKLIKISSRNFFSILRTKIYDRGEKLRRNEI